MQDSSHAEYNKRWKKLVDEGVVSRESIQDGKEREKDCEKLHEDFLKQLKLDLENHLKTARNLKLPIEIVMDETLNVFEHFRSSFLESTLETYIRQIAQMKVEIIELRSGMRK